MPEIEGQVTFHVKDGTQGALMTKAAQVDAEYNGVDEAIDYTIAQALQVVWHLDPEWLHANVLEGWTLDRVCDDDERGWHDVWPNRG